MRRIVLLAAPLVVALFAFACQDDPTNNPTVEFPEAGAYDSNRPPLPDTGVEDAPADTVQPPQPVTVVVATRKGPVAGITVVFHDATGAVLETKTTGATGKATSSAGAPTPAMATALLGKAVGRKTLMTWTGVEAGDVLAAADPESGDYLGEYSVNLPDAGTAGALNYELRFAECTNNSGVSPVTSSVYSYCANALNAPIVIAQDDSSNPIAFAFKKAVAAPVDGGTVTVDPPSWTAVNDWTVSVQNKPDAGGSPSVALYEIASTVATSNNTPNASSLDQNDQAKFKVAPGYADAYEARVTIYGPAPGSQRTMETRFASSATGGTFNLQQVLPELSEVTLDTDKVRPTISWTAVSTLATTDGGILRLRGYLGGEDSVDWNIVVAPGATTGSTKVPALPASAAEFLPDADASFSQWSPQQATFVEADALADYKAFRKGSGIFVGAMGATYGFLPANGSFKTTNLNPNF